MLSAFFVVEARIEPSTFRPLVAGFTVLKKTVLFLTLSVVCVCVCVCVCVWCFREQNEET
jgi:hypothetical protein